MTSERGGLFAPSVFPSRLILTQNAASPRRPSQAAVSSSVNTKGRCEVGPGVLWPAQPGLPLLSAALGGAVYAGPQLYGESTLPSLEAVR